MRSFNWSKAKRLAAQLIAEDDLADIQIGEQVGVTRQTLHNWRKVPQFAAAVSKERERIRDQIMSSGVSLRANRIRWIEDRLRRMRRVIEKRGADEAMKDCPGGDTGLLTRNYKSIGGGENAEKVEVFEVDTALLKEMREHERQAAQELGQWQDHVDVTSGGKPLAVKVLRGVSMDDL